MKKIIISFAVLTFFGGYFVARAEEPIQCEVGEIAQQVLVSEGTDAIPEISHVETITVVDVPQSQSCDFVGAPAGDYKHSNCSGHGQWWQEVYKWVTHPAVTHTEEVTVIDQEAVPATDAVYEWQCVVDPEYTPSEPQDEPTDDETATTTPSYRNVGGTQPECLKTGTCPCDYVSPKYQAQCIKNTYPHGVKCDLVPFSNPLLCKEDNPGLAYGNGDIDLRNQIIKGIQEASALVRKLLLELWKQQGV